jgi:hypothetical protein
VPFINLLIPIIGTASMVHVLDLALSSVDDSGRAGAPANRQRI